MYISCSKFFKKFKKPLIFIPIVLALLIAAGLFWHFGYFGKKTAEKLNLAANVSSSVTNETTESAAENVKVLDQVDYNNDTIPLLFTDNNDNENLIIKTDRQYYDASEQTEMFFSVTNTTSQDQQADIYFWFDDADKKVESVGKIENGQFLDVRRPEIAQSLDIGRLNIERKDVKGYTAGSKFQDSINAGETNYYRVVVKFPKGSSGEFFIEAFASSSEALAKEGRYEAYGHLDPYYASGLVGMWSFNGSATNWTSATAGTTNDLSGNNNTGTMTNMSRSSSPKPGISGQALSFDGVDDYVQLTSALISTGTTTVCAWVKPTNVYDWDPRAVVGENSFYLANMGFGSGIYKWILTSDASNRAESAANAMVLNIWQHVCGIRLSSGLASIYVNGVISGNPDQNSGTPVSYGDWTVLGARRSDPIQLFPGLIDEVRVYNRALTASEITDLYRLGAARMKVNSPPSAPFGNSGLVGYWSFNGQDTNWTSATAGTTNDLSGNSNTGTMTNMSRSSSPVPGVSGQAFNFTGGTDYIDAGDVYNGVKTVAFWVKTDSADKKIIDLSGSASISLASGAITTSGFTDPTIYVDGVSGATAISSNVWHFVTITTATGLNASAVALGKAAAPQQYTIYLTENTATFNSIAYDAGTCFGGTKDSYLAVSENQAYNFGGSPTIKWGIVATEYYRGIIFFPISANVPANATINSIELWFYGATYNLANNDFAVYRITDPHTFVEGTTDGVDTNNVSFYNYATGNHWDGYLTGPNYDATSLGTHDVDTQYLAWQKITEVNNGIKTYVQNIVNGTADYGLLLIKTLVSGSGADGVVSKEGTNGNRPYLKIVYTY